MDFRARGINNRAYAQLNEQIDREKELRVRWNQKLKDLDSKFSDYDNEASWTKKFSTLELQRSIDRDKFKLPEIKLIPKKKTYREEMNECFLKLGLDNELVKKIKFRSMYDQDPIEKDHLYNGISKDLEGRYKYLNERKKYKPDQKFVFPLTSSMEYGWKLYDSNSKLTPRLAYQTDEVTGSLKPSSLSEMPFKYGIKNDAIKSFYRNNGVGDLWKDESIKLQKNY